ncbi:MARVEL domain-containing protein [Meloidogyne graminicola]|uniref:MARVEL domain-containing protein n=1 Tax=Meloidogyne graminicola TaxID=189291 RepID=A0A8S9ZWA4_9BILA|nr:MARVEL domain-containing protein [Meloidogyne graminicola]
MNEIICIEQPDLFKPIQSMLAVLTLISLGSSTQVDGIGVLWFISICSVIASSVATILLMFNRNGLFEYNIKLNNGNTIIPWNIIEFIYSIILALLCGISFWISFGYSTHVHIGGHSIGYIFAGIFLIGQMICYLIPAYIIYNQTSKQNEPIAEINPYGFGRVDEEIGYQNIQNI